METEDKKGDTELERRREGWEKEEEREERRLGDTDNFSLRGAGPL